MSDLISLHINDMGYSLADLSKMLIMNEVEVAKTYWIDCLAPRRSAADTCASSSDAISLTHEPLMPVDSADSASAECPVYWAFSPGSWKTPNILGVFDVDVKLRRQTVNK